MTISRNHHHHKSSRGNNKTPDAVSALKLLPAAILALALPLPVQDREVLAYMITMCLSSPQSSSSSSHAEVQNQKKSRVAKRLQLLQCGCFECYSSYWVKWDTSPNKELIHQAIEGFEDHLARMSKENLLSKKNGRARKKESKNLFPVPASISVVEDEPEVVSSPVVHQIEAEVEKESKENFEEEEGVKGSFMDMAIVVAESPGSYLQKALVNKALLLPVAVSVLSSRFWNLWNQTN